MSSFSSWRTFTFCLWMSFENLRDISRDGCCIEPWTRLLSISIVEIMGSTELEFWLSELVATAEVWKSLGLKSFWVRPMKSFTWLTLVISAFFWMFWFSAYCFLLLSKGREPLDLLRSAGGFGPWSWTPVPIESETRAWPIISVLVFWTIDVIFDRLNALLWEVLEFRCVWSPSFTWLEWRID